MKNFLVIIAMLIVLGIGFIGTQPVKADYDCRFWCLDRRDDCYADLRADCASPDAPPNCFNLFKAQCELEFNECWSWCGVCSL